MGKLLKKLNTIESTTKESIEDLKKARKKSINDKELEIKEGEIEI